MSTPASNLTLDIPIFASRRLLLWLIAAHLAAALSLLLVDIQWPWRLLGWCLMILHGVYVWRDTAWLKPVQQLQHNNGDFFLIVDPGHGASADSSPVSNLDQGRCPVQLMNSHFVSPWLIILSLEVAGRRRRLPLFTDSSTRDALRRLRVLLRCRVEALSN